ncbi:MAG: DUF2203 domain-containing protein [Chloroflexota bacterium]|nr:DUF2203 domain-containing protein [Chloroflexota bacterium]
MPHYFTREEAETLLPAISVLLRKIQEHRQEMQHIEARLVHLRMQARGNGHNLHADLAEAQHALAQHIDALQESANALGEFGCELKDPDRGLIDFLSLRDGREVYLCWLLGEDRINYWHPLETGIAGRRPL